MDEVDVHRRSSIRKRGLLKVSVSFVMVLNNSIFVAASLTLVRGCCSTIVFGVSLVMHALTSMGVYFLSLDDGESSFWTRLLRPLSFLSGSIFFFVVVFVPPHISQWISMFFFPCLFALGLSFFHSVSMAKLTPVFGVFGCLIGAIGVGLLLAAGTFSVMAHALIAVAGFFWLAESLIAVLVARKEATEMSQTSPAGEEGW